MVDGIIKKYVVKGNRQKELKSLKHDIHINVILNLSKLLSLRFFDSIRKQY